MIDRHLVYLAQTDTTAGLLSANFQKLNQAKTRDINKPILMEVNSLKNLKNLTRVPNKFKNKIRKSLKSTFIYPNKNSFRVVKDELHLRFLNHFGQMYSTSANKTGVAFRYVEAFNMCDVLIIDKRGISSTSSSSIFKINNARIKKIR
ncbi:Sua5/YciO/YrdC/YwlC family protein [Helicobacter cappadocius]|uniref:Sua5 YciO YrdC YwlC family protein n=1 Tax=Helicobacter cappadocius TaxID=3063998 RepID=A0AA90TE21_9HELI|nr:MULTISPECIES: Sua5/YciO/YrdC/YwlC family protein [unclassified Helicobacter]MDO7252398.1 Sua5 YciO YrdC YwlC family protein [Helicobacter sp. faydin-H75]MDP2538265.1 Sua5 YciO YrdC YwlC family protein [Helicobacter sp. faydin-H76]